MVYAVDDVKQVCEHHLCHAVGAVSWYVGHGDAMTGSRLNVYNVISCRHHTYIFKVGQQVHGLLVNDHFVCEHNVGLSSAFHHLLFCGAWIHRDRAILFKRFPRKVAGVQTGSI